MARIPVDLAKARVFVYETMIREQHLDFFGHVNNSAYTVLFEEARWEMITSGGYGAAETQRTGVGPIILDMHLRFKKELKNRERIRIESRCIKYSGRIGTLGQTMLNAAGETACAAEYTYALFDLKERRLVEPTAAWVRALGFDD